MKKILFVSQTLGYGGISKALVNLINNIKDNYEIDLLVEYIDNTVIDDIPPNVSIKLMDFPYRFLGISQSEVKSYGVKYYMEAAVLRIFTKFGFKKQVMQYLLKHTNNVEKEYDVAISYTHNPSDKQFFSGCNEFVLNKVKANKKISFIHADYSKFGGNTTYNNNLLKNFDYIACVSEDCKKTLLELTPNLTDKVVVVNNCVNYDLIRKKFTECNRIEYNHNQVNIITIARLSSEKGVLRMIPIIANLIDNGIKIHYYIVGNGPEKEDIIKRIANNKLDNNVTLLGMQSNPYKYLNGVDFLVQPSYQEAESVVIKEALGLHIPVLSTETISAQKMIPNEYGFVCENTDEALENALLDIICNKKYMEKAENLKRFYPTDINAVNQFKEIIG